jgi:N-acetylmuramoyl-L-alanine amidase
LKERKGDILNDRRYGKRTKRSSPLGNALLVLLVVLLLGGGVFAAKKMGLLPPKKASQAESSAVETLAETAEDASVSHAPAASLIAPVFDDEEEKPSEEQAVQTAQETVTTPLKPALPGEGITVCIDPGHGGKDPGCNTPDRLEKDDVLRLGLAMRTCMEAQGITVIMTRDDDSYPTLDDRCHIANKAKVDYFISVHRNIYAGDDASDVYGTEIWKCSTASEEAAALADNLMDALEGVGVQRARGVKEGSQSGSGDYYVLNHTKMPSALLEMGFMQNKKDNKYFDKNVDEYAEALTQAVLDTWEEFHVDLDDVANMDKS